GGFSRSPLLLEMVQTVFDQPGCSVVRVHEPDLAIVKGAVMYFDRSTVFNSRRARLTYGTDLVVPFDSKNPEHVRRREAGRVTETDEGLYVSGVFDVHIEVGDNIPAGGVLKQHALRPLFKTRTTGAVVIYASSNKNPTYVDDISCFEVGRLSFQLDMTKDYTERGYRVEFTFGGPELSVKILHRTEER
ncbi:unnamed protein product, partial [Scytosiphon promiscuus]